MSEQRTALAKSEDNTTLYASLALRGDISGLTPGDKAAYYGSLCERLGLDANTQPFIPLKLNGKEILYASRTATDQLARLHNVTRTVTSRERVEDVYVVTVRAALPGGRTEDSIGAVPLGTNKGEALANALMKAETKAKRRATLAILGLGMLDESGLQTIPPGAMQPLDAPSVASVTPMRPRPLDTPQAEQEAWSELGDEIAKEDAAEARPREDRPRAADGDAEWETEDALDAEILALAAQIPGVRDPHLAMERYVKRQHGFDGGLAGISERVDDPLAVKRSIRDKFRSELDEQNQGA